MGEHPVYVEPSKGGVVLSNTAENAHAILDKGDPKHNGPWLDDLRKSEEVSYRKQRKSAFNKTTKKSASKKAAFKPKKASSSNKVTSKAPTKKSTAKKTTAKKAVKK